MDHTPRNARKPDNTPPSSSRQTERVRRMDRRILPQENDDHLTGRQRSNRPAPDLDNLDDDSPHPTRAAATPGAGRKRLWILCIVTVLLVLFAVAFYTGLLDGLFGQELLAPAVSISASPSPEMLPAAAPTAASSPSPTPIVFATPIPTPLPAPEPTALIATPTMLTSGASGTDVSRMQQALIALGYLPQGADDGSFGSATKDAVKAFQLANGLDADGIAGEQTLRKLFGPDAVPATPDAL